jgi:hypothetical protein
MEGELQRLQTLLEQKDGDLQRTEAKLAKSKAHIAKLRDSLVSITFRCKM